MTHSASQVNHFQPEVSNAIHSRVPVVDRPVLVADKDIQEHVVDVVVEIEVVHVLRIARAVGIVALNLLIVDVGLHALPREAEHGIVVRRRAGAQRRPEFNASQSSLSPPKYVAAKDDSGRSVGLYRPQ